MGELKKPPDIPSIHGGPICFGAWKALQCSFVWSFVWYEKEKNSVRIVWRTRSFWFMANTESLIVTEKDYAFSWLFHSFLLMSLFVVYLDDVIDVMNDSFWSALYALFSFVCSLLANIYFHLMINLSSPTLHFSIHYLIVSGRQFSFRLYVSHRRTHAIPIHSTQYKVFSLS